MQEIKTKKPKVVDEPTTHKSAASKQAKPKPTQTVVADSKALEVVDDDVWADSEEDDIADQSAALLQGFESSDEDEDDDAAAVSEIPAIPTDKTLAKKLKAASKADEEGAGVVYVGRIPHGFYEHQMRAYFSQFGEITRLRLSRNKKTGHSKHYAFIEFASREVAKIVAATMNKYLLFGHILQVRTLAPEEVHPDLFKGANKRFKTIPRNKIQGRQLRLPKERDIWEKRIANENRRRKDKEDQLKMLGYVYKAPKLTSTKAIPFRKQSVEDAVLIEGQSDSQLPKGLPAPAKKTKSKSREIAIGEAEAAESETPVPAKAKKTKAKTKKSKGEAA